MLSRVRALSKAFLKVFTETFPALFRETVSSIRSEGVRRTVSKIPLALSELRGSFRGYYREDTVESAAEHRRQWTGAARNMVSESQEQVDRQELLYELIEPRTPSDASILEIGYQFGDNLQYLYERGYRDLTGVDVDPSTVDVVGDRHPDMFSDVDLRIGPIEELVDDFDRNEFDVVFSANTLSTIAPESEWVFPEIARITADYLITMEPETADSQSGSAFKLNYRRYDAIFTDYGLDEVVHLDGSTPSTAGFDIRVFTTDSGSRDSDRGL